VVTSLSSRPLVHGEAVGSVLLSQRALSLWGGIDPETGRIVDPRHDRCGETVSGRIFALPAEKGSSTGSAILLELARTGRAPAAIIVREPAVAIAVGAIVAGELYGRRIPVFCVDESGFAVLEDGETIRITEAGKIERTRGEP